MEERNPKIIWHYTSLSALENFKECFKGKCAAAFQDPGEISLGQEYLPDRIKKSETCPPDRYFVGCFTVDEDNDRHWKERTMNGGVSLGFNLQKMIKNRLVFFFHCYVCYSIPKYQEYINRKIDEYLNDPLRKELIPRFSSIAPAILKDKKWEWEHEYRIFYIGDSDDVWINGAPVRLLFRFSDCLEQIIMSPYSETKEDFAVVDRFLARAMVKNHVEKRLSRWMVWWDENTKRRNGLKLRKG